MEWTEVKIINLVFTVLLGGGSWLAGYLLLRKPPEQSSSWFGYRTKRAKKNETLWKEANEQAGSILKRDGLMLLAAGIAMSLFVETYWIMPALFGIMLYLLLMMFLRVEMALKFMEEQMEKKKVTEDK